MALIAVSGYAGSGKDTVGKIIQYLQCENVGKVSLQEAIDDHDSHVWWLQEQSGWEIKKWAGKLKQIASLLTGIPVEKFEDQEFKKTYLGPEWDTWGILRGPTSDRQVAIQSTPHEPDGPWLKHSNCTQVHNRMTVREFLQKLGTDGLRMGLHDNVWLNALMSDYNIQSLRSNKRTNWIITDTRFPNEAQAIKDKGGVIIRVDRPGVTAVNAHPSETSLDNWDFDYKIANVSDLEALAFTVQGILKELKLT
jgi:hypothetical protein